MLPKIKYLLITDCGRRCARRGDGHKWAMRLVRSLYVARAYMARACTARALPSSPAQWPRPTLSARLFTSNSSSSSSNNSRHTDDEGGDDEDGGMEDGDEAMDGGKAVAETSNGNAKVVRTRDEFGRAYGTGRRKTSVARVWIKEGSGQIVVNDKSFIDYFQPIQRDHALGAFVASKTAGLFDTFCTVKGGGISGQAGAVRLGISRALEVVDPSYRVLLRKEDMLTRDSRRVERKKPGQKKARKQFQWVKR